MSRRLELLLPLFFWLILLSVYLIRWMPLMTAEQLSYNLKILSVTFPLDIGAFSFFYFWLIPRALKEDKLLKSIFIGLLFWLAYSLVWVFVYQLTGRISNPEGFLRIYQSSLGHTVLHTLYALVLRLSVDGIKRRERQKELEQQNTQTELALLRSQVNPHFLFNVLNNIHSYVYEDPDKTSFSLIKLSEIMRYMLYETNASKVLLDQEIEYIQNYLALQRLRLQKGKNIRFNVSGNTAGIRIAPMLFIPFIENTFKHGRKNHEKGIEINLDVNEGYLEFSCHNYKRQWEEKEDTFTESFGLKNIRRRLELLYPQKHELKILNDDEKFQINLSIQPF